MVRYHVFWLIAMAMNLAAALVILGMGCYLLRKVVEDVSNSATKEAFAVRLFRVAPGVLLIVFGSVLLWRLVERMSLLALPERY
jgi:hypothetical protein